MTPLSPGSFYTTQHVTQPQALSQVPALPKHLVQGTSLSWNTLLNYMFSPEESIHFSHSTASVATNIVVHVILTALTHGARHRESGISHQE